VLERLGIMSKKRRHTPQNELVPDKYRDSFGGLGASPFSASSMRELFKGTATVISILHRQPDA
jgi:hypothetical protein